MIRSRGALFTLRYAHFWLVEWHAGWTQGLDTEEGVSRTGPRAGDDASYYYAPTPYTVLKKVFRRLAIEPDGDVFLDYGAGKGRVVLHAALHPFARVIGVEASAELCAIAEANVRRAPGPLRCREITIANADARDFPVPDDVTVVFFFEPFGRAVLEPVLAQLEASLRRRPRGVRIVYVNNAGFEATIATRDWIKKRSEFYFFVMPCWGGFYECVPPAVTAGSRPVDGGGGRADA
jgi:predicted RNA methylase